ncbi:MAG: diguanylate cyclase [Elusimicrobia bacterium]|nr:MAG: diguanylate cyclase [Elusimicrobiota bacterium]
MSPRPRRKRKSYNPSVSDRRNAPHPEPREIPPPVSFALLGALLGLGSPVGAFLLRFYHAEPRIFAMWMEVELSANADFYGYMGLGTVAAFAFFGWYVGNHIESHRVRNRNLRRRVEELHLKSVTDGLTGAYSHAYLQEVLGLELERAKAEGGPLSILMMDLDDFKKLNDGHGHLFGDRVLKELTETASMNIRHEDVLGRYGGEEFLVIMPGADADIAAAVAERVRRSFERAGILPMRGEGGTVTTTVSIGAATYPGKGDTDPRALISKADTNLYSAKRAGKNKVVS